VLIGEYGVGKTSIIKRYVYNYYSEQYIANIGAEHILKVENYNKNRLIRLQLWDTAGMTMFK
jgi:Ras-related protein Rab-32